MKTLPRGYPRPITLLIAIFLIAFSPLALVLPGPALAAASQGSDEAIVIEAEARVRESNPTGRQELRLTGGILDPAPLDPAFARDVNSAFLTRQVFRGLTRFDEDLQPAPELADRIEISPDGLTYTFRLAEEARFADGSTITADDVVKSLTRALDPRTAAAEGAALAGPSYLSDIAGAAELIRGETEELSGARALDERTIEINLVAPRATFLMKMASSPAAIVDPDDVARGGEWWRDPNASGPFVVESWVPDEVLRLGPNPAYIGGPPDLQIVSFRLGPSSQNAFNLYEANEIDVTYVPLHAIERVSDEASPLRAELDVSPILATEYIAFRTDVAPMDDPEIRRAVQLAFPRWKVAEILLTGTPETAHGLIPPGTLGREWPDVAPEPDLEAARAAITASSYGSAENVPPIRIYAAGAVGAGPLRDVLERDLGLTVEVFSVHWPQFNHGLTQKRFPAYELQWVADYPDPETFLWSLFYSASPDNYSDYANPKFDALLEQAAETLDVEERAALYAEAEAVLAGDNAMMPITHDVRYTLMKPWVHGLEITPLGMLYLEPVWIER
jgi:peptide/nickel transport system substrate-binding protein/oligopeptide transport system substrate-binding protein